MKAGARVNVEPDVIGRWVEHHVRRLLPAADPEHEEEGVMHHARFPFAAFALLVVVLGGCQGRTGFMQGGTGSGSGGRNPQIRGGQVSLTDQDLAPVDAYIGVRNAQWILGDDVEVIASREYFGQNLTIARATGLVERRDVSVDGETTVTLTYVGDPAWPASARTHAS